VSTEIQGIAQSDVLIRTAIVRSLERLYADPSQLDHVFHSLAEDEETRAVYGEKQIELAKNWFLTSHVPVFMAFRVAEEQIPCITISLQESVEAEQTHGDVHYIPQEETAGDWPVLSGKFTPLAYSPVSGIMVLPSGLMGDQLIAPGMFVLTRDGRKYEIKENLGDDEISLAPNTVGDFVNAVIKGARKRYVTTIESVFFKETYQIGIHVQNEPAYLLYLHAIVMFCLMKFKQDLLEARGFERSVISSTDFRRNQEFDVEEVFSRFINITGFVQQSWPKDVRPMIDVVNLKIPPSNRGLIVSAGGDNTFDGEQSVNEAGKPPDSDDPWSVIPQE
jgi:hypothetical protein